MIVDRWDQCHDAIKEYLKHTFPLGIDTTWASVSDERAVGDIVIGLKNDQGWNTGAIEEACIRLEMIVGRYLNIFPNFFEVTSVPIRLVPVSHDLSHDRLCNGTTSTRQPSEKLSWIVYFRMLGGRRLDFFVKGQGALKTRF